MTATMFGIGSAVADLGASYFSFREKKDDANYCLLLAIVLGVWQIGHVLLERGHS